MLEINECNKCDELVSNRTRISHGWGSTPATFMFIGEAPGTGGADVTGKAFTSRHSGAIFKRIIDLSEIIDFYVTNIVKCRPRDNRKPSLAEILNCSYIINEELRDVQPKIIVCLGKTAFNYIINKYSSFNYINSFRHCLYISKTNPKILASLHPSIINENQLQQLVNFLKNIKNGL